MTSIRSDPEPARAIGELCIQADWACRLGDLLALGHITDRLAGYLDEPLHCELAALAELCRCHPERAVAAWTRLKDRMFPPAEHPWP